MDQQQNQLIKKYLDLFIRWRVFIFACILFSLPLGLVIYLKTPKVYQSTSLLSYQQQKISPNKMSPDIEAAIRDVVSSLTQIVTSRTNLENAITSLDLYSAARKRLPMEDVVDLMRKDIKIEPLPQGDIFQIKYSGSEPDKVMKVTNSLAAKFIEENLKFREERASETSSYTSDELAMAKEVMDQKEATMRDYKLKYYNELPEQREINVSRLISLQEQYQGKQESIQDLEKTMVLIQDQVANRRKLIETENEADLTGDGKTNFTMIEREAPVSTADKLLQLQSALKNLRIKYTENHPDVKRVKRLIAKLEKEPAAGDEDLAKTGGTHNSVDQVVLQSEAQLKGIALSIQNLNEEREDLKKTISQYEQWVAAAPVREAEWSALTREYGELKRHYDFLVSSDLQAKSMLNLEKRQKGSQFKIEDSARFPEKPIKPDFVKILGIALFCGLGLGLGIPLIWDFLDASFRDVNDLEAFLGVPVVCSIPFIEIGREKAWRRKKFQFEMIGGISAFLLVITLFVYCWNRGLIAL